MARSRAVVVQLFLSILLVAACPLSAFAVDTDGDGVDDSVDAFPNKIEASVDTDGDGMPNSFTIPVPEQFNGTTLDASWQKSPSGVQVTSGRLEFGVYGGASIWKTVTTGTYVSFNWDKGQIASSSVSFYIDNVLQSCTLVSCTVSLSPGVHTLKWTGVWPCLSSLCMNYTKPWVDNINFGFTPSLTEDVDDDNDGVLDTADQCPLIPTCSQDADGDGIDNSVEVDDDNDGVLDGADNCPLTTNADQLNTDGDAYGNACDTDDDNDGVADTTDKFPLNAAASSDTDNDGYPGSWNGACDVVCQANSGLVLDNCPSTANVDQINTDGDSQGNACDSDDDNDGVPDTGDAFPLDNTQAGDMDADGIEGLVDNCPSNANADQLNTDGDTQGNVCDSDDDNDGVSDGSDRFPLNLAASSDTDLDGYPGSWNAACDTTCQTNSGLVLDNCPSTANADQLNTDGDTQGNVCDGDDDNDGVVDIADALPLDATEFMDTDGDAIGNNADPDNDNDGLADGDDNCPDTANADQQDDDSDGLGDICDLSSKLQPLMDAGDSHTCALTTTSGVKCWGMNLSGQLGDNTTTDKNTPMTVVNLSSGIAGVSAGDYHTCALTSAGGVKCWGNNGYGQLGDGTNTNRLTPVDVVGLGSGVLAVEAGASHTCALTSAGGMKCWGYNNHGQLGDGTVVNRSTPVDVVGLQTGVVSLGLNSFYTCALTSAGGVKCWGWNPDGRLGNGTLIESSSPVDVAGLQSGVVAIAAGLQHVCALTHTGGVRCWGRNDYAQLGDGTFTNREIPVNVAGLTAGVAGIAAGYAYTCALMNTGGEKCWGANYNRQLGDGTYTNRTAPADVVGLQSGVAAISSGYAHNCALLISGGIKCWGWNLYGQSGDGTTVTHRATPVWVVGFDDADNDGFVGLADNCPSTANADQFNTDGDTQGNVCDSDDDNDGVADASDAFPLNAAESLDTDLDGTGNNADPDDDNDGLPDVMDPLPLQVKFNRDANYQGSQVRDASQLQ